MAVLIFALMAVPVFPQLDPGALGVPELSCRNRSGTRAWFPEKA